MPLPRVKINLTGDPRENLIEVNGSDITAAIRGVQVIQNADEAMGHVVLHLKATVELDTDIAEVLVERDVEPPVAALRELLDQVDPGEMEEAALAKMGGLEGGPATVGAAFVAVLKEWASD